MPEEKAFCVLTKVMFDYGMRDLFKLGFDALHLRFHQLHRLIEVVLEKEYTINSYQSQNFRTMSPSYSPISIRLV